MFAILLVLIVIAYRAPSTAPALQNNGVTGGTYTGGVTSQNGYRTVYLAVSDPSELPNGTTSLTFRITNSSAYAWGYGWVRSPGYGQINLVSLSNASLVVSRLEVPENALLTESSIGVQDAKITISGKTYQMVSENVIVAPVIGNGIGNTVLLSITPFVAPSYNTSSTNSTVSAVFAANSVLYNNLTQTTIGSYDKAGSVSDRNLIWITSPSLMVNGSNISLSFQVSGSGPDANIGKVIITGPLVTSYDTNKVENISEAYASEAVSKYIDGEQQNSAGSSLVTSNGIVSLIFNTSSKFNSSSIGISEQYYTGAMQVAEGLSGILISNFSTLTKGTWASNIFGSANGETRINVTALKVGLATGISNSIYNNDVAYANLQTGVKSVGFGILDNGTLVPNGAEQGITIGSGNDTLAYNGVISIGKSGTVQVSLIKGANYTIGVIGENDSYATASVTAT